MGGGKRFKDHATHLMLKTGRPADVHLNANVQGMLEGAAGQKTPGKPVVLGENAGNFSFFPVGSESQEKPVVPPGDHGRLSVKRVKRGGCLSVKAQAHRVVKTGTFHPIWCHFHLEEQVHGHAQGVLKRLSRPGAEEFYLVSFVS